MPLTRINNQSLANVTSAGLPSGTVLQIKSATFADYQDISSTSWTDVSDLTISITPTNSNSKFYVIANVCGGATNAGYYGFHVRLARTISNTTTPLQIGNAWGSRDRCSLSLGQYNSGGSPITNGTAQTLDSPSTTSAITYKVQFKATQGLASHRINGFYNNNDDNSHRPAAASSITVMEIAG